MGRAVFAIAASASTASADPVDPAALALELQAPQSPRRIRAARELVGLEPARAAPLVRRALEDANPDVRAAAASVAAQLGLAELSPTLRAMATSPEPRLREAISMALGLLRPSDEGEVRAVESLLVRALADPEPAVRLAALHALAERPMRPAARAARLDAIAAVLGDEHPELRRAAAESLERLADASSLHALAAHIDDASPEVRLAIARALGVLGDPRAAPAVLRLADDSSEEVRAAAITTLGALAAAIAVPRLTPILERPRNPMAGLAAVALGRIAGGARADDDATTTALRARAGESLVAACRGGDNRSAALEGLRASGTAAAPLLRELLPALGPRPSDELLLLAADRAAAGDGAVLSVLLDGAALATDSRFDAALTAARPRPVRSAIASCCGWRRGSPIRARRRGVRPPSRWACSVILARRARSRRWRAIPMRRRDAPASRRWRAPAPRRSRSSSPRPTPPTATSRAPPSPRSAGARTTPRGRRCWRSSPRATRRPSTRPRSRWRVTATRWWW